MYVAFVDLLGFASAVESLSDAHADAFAQLVSETVSLHGSAPLSIDLTEPPVRDLYTMYTKFQRECEHVAWQLSKFDSYTRFQSNRSGVWSAPSILQTAVSSHRTVVFSDSMFFASTALEPVLDAAGELLVRLLMEGIPSRGAIAKGHFHTFEWNLRAGQTESFRANAPFLGSGVIRAYRAESKGPRGIRLIIHESCRDDVRALDSWALVELAPDEVSQEWREEADLGLSVKTGLGGMDYLSKKLNNLRAKAPEHVRARHYDPTVQAFFRMAANRAEGTERQYARIDLWRDEDW